MDSGTELLRNKEKGKNRNGEIRTVVKKTKQKKLRQWKRKSE